MKSNWGTARNIQIGNTSKSVNGSGNVSWTLDEMGALPTVGGTMTGTITSNVTTGSHINGAKGINVIINSTAPASGYNMLAKLNSENGVFNLGTYNRAIRLYYISNTIISSNSNTITHDLSLLNEDGNSKFPGEVSATKFKGPLEGNASTATKLANLKDLLKEMHQQRLN